jgi:hypothetical protein
VARQERVRSASARPRRAPEQVPSPIPCAQGVESLQALANVSSRSQHMAHARSCVPPAPAPIRYYTLAYQMGSASPAFVPWENARESTLGGAAALTQGQHIGAGNVYVLNTILYQKAKHPSFPGPLVLPRIVCSERRLALRLGHNWRSGERNVEIVHSAHVHAPPTVHGLIHEVVKRNVRDSDRPEHGPAVGVLLRAGFPPPAICKDRSTLSASASCLCPA